MAWEEEDVRCGERRAGRDGGGGTTPARSRARRVTKKKRRRCPRGRSSRPRPTRPKTRTHQASSPDHSSRFAAFVNASRAVLCRVRSRSARDSPASKRETLTTRTPGRQSQAQWCAGVLRRRHLAKSRVARLGHVSALPRRGAAPLLRRHTRQRTPRARLSSTRQTGSGRSPPAPTLRAPPRATPSPPPPAPSPRG